MQTTFPRALLAVVAAFALCFFAAVGGGVGEDGPQNAMGYVLDIVALLACFYAVRSVIACCWTGFQRHMGR